MIKKKFYLITWLDLIPKTLIIFDIKVMVKFGDMTYHIKPEDRFKNKKKTRPKNIT